MSFVGKLDQFRITDLLQIISTTSKSGRLTLTRRDADGVIVFRQGKIIYAASTSARETLGSLLLCQNLIEERQLLEALEIQHQAEEEKRLGSILVDMGALDRAALQRVVGQQTEKIITEFMHWETGFFKFDLLKLPDQGEIEVDARDFVVEGGLSTDRVLLSIATRLDELERDQQIAREAAAELEPDEEARGGRGPGEETPSLKSIMAHIRSPEFTGELTIKILTFARTLMRRGALFVARQDGLCGMGQFGLPGDDADERICGLKIPTEGESTLNDTAERKENYRGPLADCEWDRRLVRRLGGDAPAESIVLPLVVNDRVLLLFYGDNAPTGEPIGDLDELELLLLQAGLAMEKSMLEKRLARVESQLRR